MTCPRTFRPALNGNDREAVMSKLEREVVSITGNHNGIRPGPIHPIGSGISLDEIERRII